MDSESERVANKFLNELAEEFKTEDISNLKKAFKGLAITLENKDDLKQAIEYLKNSKAISEEKAAEMQQAAEETRAFRENIRKNAESLEREIKEIQNYSQENSKYQKQHWEATLETQRKLLDIGEKVNPLIFAQAFSDNVVKELGKSEGFKNLFGESKHVQGMSAAMTKMLSGFGQIGNGISMMHGAGKDSEKAKKEISEHQKEINFLNQKLALAREEGDETKIQEIKDEIEGKNKALAGAMAKRAGAEEYKRLGKKKFEELYGEGGYKSKRFEERKERAAARYLEELNAVSDISSGDNDTGDGKSGGSNGKGGKNEGGKSSGDSKKMIENQKKMLTYLAKIAKNAENSKDEKDDSGEEGEENGDSGENDSSKNGKTGSLKDKLSSALNAFRSKVKEVKEDEKKYIAGKDKDEDENKEEDKNDKKESGIAGIKLERTKTPRTLPQLLGAHAWWLEEQLKDAEEEEDKKDKKADPLTGGDGNGITDLLSGTKNLSGIVKNFGPMVKNLGATVGRMGPMLGSAAGFLGQAALVVGAGVVAYKAGNYIGDLWSDWWTEREVKELQEKKQKEEQKRVEMLQEYAEASDDEKSEIAQKHQKENEKLAEKQVNLSSKRKKLLEERRAALASGDTEKAQELMEEANDINTELQDVVQERNKYKELANKENARQAKSKSELDMQKNAANSGKPSGNADVVNAITDLKDDLTAIVSAGTAHGLNNA